MKKLITFMANLTLILALTLSLAVSAFALTPADSAETSVITYSDEQLLNPLAGELPQNPLTAEAFHQVFNYAARNNLSTITISYTIPYQSNYQALITNFLSETVNTYTYRYPEYFNYLRKVSFSTIKEAGGWSIKLNFNSKNGTGDTEAMQLKRTEADAKAEEVYQGLIDNGSLHDGMTEKERAKVILNWVLDNVSYLDDNSALSHTAWNAFFNGTAVCDGYSSTYQLLLRLDGIKCWGQKGMAAGENHHWTVAVVDGKTVNIDSSWCDTAKRDRFFAVSDLEFALTHSW